MSGVCACVRLAITKQESFSLTQLHKEVWHHQGHTRVPPNKRPKYTLSLPLVFLFLSPYPDLTLTCYSPFQNIHFWYLHVSSLLFLQYKQVPSFQWFTIPHYACILHPHTFPFFLYVNDCDPTVTPGDGNRKSECFPSVFEAWGNMYLITTSFRKQKYRHVYDLLTVNMSWHPPKM